MALGQQLEDLLAGPYQVIFASTVEAEVAQDMPFSVKPIMLRAAVPSDILMMQTFILEHGPNPWNFLPELEVRAHIAEIGTKKVQAYCAEREGECLGFATFYEGLPESCQKYEADSDHKIAYLCEIVVDRACVGQGIGSKLIEAVKAHCDAQGIHRLYAERHSENPGSAGVMLRTGFTVIDEYDDPRRSTGSKRTTVTRLVW